MQGDFRDQILEKALQLVPSRGWSSSTLSLSAGKVGLDPQISRVLFPNGPIELIDYYLKSLDQEMINNIKNLPLNKMRIRDRIKEALFIRIKIIIKRKDVILKTISFLTLPWNILHAKRISWRVADLIWTEAGLDHSTDFNYYTKRFLLMKVYESAVMYCLNDKSHNLEDTFDFLERRIENVVTFGKIISRFKK